MSADITNGEIFPSNYQVFQCDRSDSAHGRVFIAVSDALIATEVTELETNCELKWIKIQVAGAKPLLIGALYCSQKTDLAYMKRLEQSMYKIQKNANICLLGDFNMPSINWSSHRVEDTKRSVFLC